MNINAIKSNYRKSGELLFNPKISKNRQFEPLFNKYEQLEGQVQISNIDNNFSKEPIFKQSQEIFPSHLGFEMPYKSKLKDNLYKTSTYNNYRKSLKKDKKFENENDSTKKKEKTEKKNYYSFKSSIKSDNPFKGPSEFEKSVKERKNKIAKTVEKEENEFYDIAIIEEKISSKSDLNEEELNQLINRFKEIMYKNYTDNSEEMKGFEYKINKIENIIKIMGNDEQIKILNNLKESADNDYKNEMFEKLKNNIDEYNKNKKIKLTKNEKDEEDEVLDYSLKVKSNKKKVFKNSIK